MIDQDEARGSGEVNGTRVADPFTHTLVVNASPEALADEAVPFLRRALDDGDTVHVNLSSARNDALRSGLGPDADRVSFTDTEVWEPHPVRRLRALLSLVDGHRAEGGGRLRFLGECVWSPDTDPVLDGEWERLEAVVNRVLAGSSATIVCVCDLTGRPPASVERLRATHPYSGLASPVAVDEYLAPERFLARCRPDRLPVPAGAARLPGYSVGARVREQLSGLLAGTGAGGAGWLDPDDPDALLVGTTELVTNAWQAGATAVGVACWVEGAWILVQVDDDGPGLADDLAGYRRPPPDAVGGRGLWITRQLADAVDAAWGTWGTSVRLRLRRACGSAPAAGS